MENRKQPEGQAIKPSKGGGDEPRMKSFSGDVPDVLSDLTQTAFQFQAIHLKLLTDLLRKLKPQREIKRILDAFLMFLLEDLQLERATILLFDPQQESSLIHSRDGEQECLSSWSEEEVNSLCAYLAYLFKKSGESALLSSEVLLFPEARPLPLKQLFNQDSICYWFVFSETQLGFLALRAKRRVEIPRNDDYDLLKDLINLFIPFLERAKGLEKIRDLTLDVEQRLDQIKKISIDLTVSRQRLKIFEKVPLKIKQAISREIEQTRKVSAWDILLILGLGLILGVVFNLINPGGINPFPQAWVQPALPEINVLSAKGKSDSGGALLVDARPNAQFTYKHIRGAVNLPLAIFDFVYLMKFSRLEPEKELIVYGRNVSRHYDQEVAYLLKAKGHENVVILSGGLPAWQEKGFPTEP